MKLERRKGHKNAVRAIIGAILIMVGTGWYLYPCYREWQVRKNADAVITELEQHTAATEAAGTEAAGTETAGGASADMGEQDEAPALQELYAEMSLYNAGLTEKGQKLSDAWDFEQVPEELSALGTTSAFGCIGCIEIPDMGVKMPLYIGASHSNMAKGAAVLAGTSMPIGGESTNCVICGHRGWKGSAYFRNIEDMMAGSLVYITNPWKTLTYKAVSAKIIHSSELENIFIQPGRDMVTLFSCYPYAHTGTPYRYVVFCERVTEMPDMTAPSTTKKPLPMEGTKADQRVAAKEDALLFLEQTLRYILPVAVILIAILIRLAHKTRERSPKKDPRTSKIGQ